MSLKDTFWNCLVVTDNLGLPELGVVLHIIDVDANGKLTATYNGDPVDKGTYSDQTSEIKFHVNRTRFKYRGTVVAELVIVLGRREKDRGKEESEDGTWTATKTGGGGVPDKKKKTSAAARKQSKSTVKKR